MSVHIVLPETDTRADLGSGFAQHRCRHACLKCWPNIIANYNWLQRNRDRKTRTALYAEWSLVVHVASVAYRTCRLCGEHTYTCHVCAAVHNSHTVGVCCSRSRYVIHSLLGCRRTAVTYEKTLATNKHKKDRERTHTHARRDCERRFLEVVRIVDPLQCAHTHTCYF